MPLKKDIPDMSDRLLEIGARIAHFRRQKNLSQEELAEQVFITPTQLSRIERGQVNCKLMTLLSLGRSLEVSTDELLGVDSPENESLAELQSILEHFTKKERRILHDILLAAQEIIRRNKTFE